MNANIIEAMVRKLTPVLKDKARAQKILTRYWRTRMALVWDTKDVYQAANELEVALTETEAIRVLQTLHQQHNPQLGLRWEDIMAHIEVHVLGRKLNRREVKQFVETGKLFIQR